MILFRDTKPRQCHCIVYKHVYPQLSYIAIKNLLHIIIYRNLYMVGFSTALEHIEVYYEKVDSLSLLELLRASSCSLSSLSSLSFRAILRDHLVCTATSYINIKTMPELIFVSRFCVMEVIIVITNKLCEKKYFFMSNLHYSLTNAALCPLVLLPSLSLKKIFLSTSS